MIKDFILTNLGTIFLAISAAVPALMGWRKGMQNEQAILKIHLEINSRLDELISAVKAVSYGIGHTEGVAQEHKRAQKEATDKENKGKHP